MDRRPQHDPLLEARRLERLMLLVRIGGALLVPALGPLFVTVDDVHLVVLAGALLVWSAGLAVILPRVQTPEQQRRLSLLGFFVDVAIVIYGFWIFSADPNWTIWVLGPLIIVGSAFRFGRLGAIASALILASAYIGIAQYRADTYGLLTPVPSVAFNVIVYLLTALLLSGTLRELYALRAQREYQFFHDVLTGLANRALLTERLEQSLLRGRREKRETALLRVDLNNFKAVNDGLGHDAGDALLKEVGGRLRSQLRASDTVARFAADEFGILLPATDVAGAQLVADKVVRALEVPFILANEALDVGGSVGIAVAPAHADDAEQLLSRADVALHAAKAALSGFTVFDAEQDPGGTQRLALLADLRRGIEEGELLLHYQPIVDARSGALRSVEALVRWMSPARGLVPPLEFIPIAEQTGLIHRLTREVLTQAIRQTRAWELAGLRVPVAVNLSIRSLLDPQLPQMLADLLARWNASGDLLRFEITESVLAAQPERMLATIAGLRATGAKMALDDFGTGYSSLAYLHRLPIDELKIDGTFVRGMLREDASATIVRATIDLGHSLGYAVVAEGVEDDATWDALVGLGCDMIQGFLLARPMGTEDLTSWIATRGDRASSRAANHSRPRASAARGERSAARPTRATP